MCLDVPEPPGGLRRAGVVVLSRCDQVGASERGRLREAIARFAPGMPIAETRHRPMGLTNSERHTAPLLHLEHRPVAAFCGIGNPEAFRRTLTDLGVSVCAFRTFSDHHAYTRTDVEDLRSWAQGLDPEGIVVTTQKDLVKLRLTRLGGKALWALRICLHVEAGQEALDRKLRQVLSAEC